MRLSTLIASDHAGFALKERLKQALQRLGVPFVDYGPDSEASVDYPDFAHRVAQAVGNGQAERGVLICGSGQGMVMAANRHAGVRAALPHDEAAARLARQHNDANVLALGARVTPPEEAERILQAFLETPFEGGRHQRRVDKIDDPPRG
jgi:ribose 5-phosphate isomerase B